MDLFKRNRLSPDFTAVPAEPSGAELTPPTIDRSAIVAELDQLTFDCWRAGRMDLADRVIDAPIPHPAGAPRRGARQPGEDSVKHVIEMWESGSRGCWSCDCGCGGSVSADGDVEIAAEKHLNPDDRVVYRYTKEDQGWP